MYRKNWMFRLVGSEMFHIGKKNKVAEITISSKGMSFEYALTVDGKPLEKFVQAQAKNTRTWLPNINGTDHRVVLGENSTAILQFQHINPYKDRHHFTIMQISCCTSYGEESSASC